MVPEVSIHIIHLSETGELKLSESRRVPLVILFLR